MMTTATINSAAAAGFVLETATFAAITSTQQQVDGFFDDIINHGYRDDDDGGGGREGCCFHIGECYEDAKFWIAVTDNKAENGRRKVFFCPRHFALYLHLVIEALRRNVYFDELTTTSQIREVVHSYFLEWDRIG